LLAASAAAAGGEAPSPTGAPLLLQVLITGAADGGLRVWSLGRRSAGRPLLASFPHTSPVRRLLLPPPGCGPRGAPACWRSCVLSVAEDGSIALTSLAAGGLVRLLRGFPFGQPAEVHWDVGRWALLALLLVVAVVPPPPRRVSHAAPGGLGL
jgi:hypothetical protein